ARSAPGSPRSSARAPAPTAPGTTARAPPSRRASPRSAPDRSGMEKPARLRVGSVNGMDIKIATCFIPVDDHDRALAFYRDALGFEVRNDVDFEGMRWVSLGSPSQPDVEIVLEPPIGDPHASQSDKDAAAELLAKGLLRGVN